MINNFYMTLENSTYVNDNSKNIKEIPGYGRLNINDESEFL